MDYVCVHPDCYTEASSPQCDGIWGWDLWETIKYKWGPENQTLLMRLLLLLEDMGGREVTEDRQESSPPHLCEDSARQEERFSPEPKHAGAVISNFQPP